MGLLYALLAALCNSSIGILSRFTLSANIDFYQIAFGKSFIAFLLLSIIALMSSKVRTEILTLRKRIKELAILSFTGIFVLYFFETKAFSIAPVASVAFAVYASGIFTVFLGYFFLKESMNTKKLVGILVVVTGSVLLTGEYPDLAEPLALLYAMIGGIGYSLFLVFGRKFNLQSSFGFLWWLMALGSAYLLIPSLIFHDFNMTTEVLTGSSMAFLLPLAILPTIGGFYFTSKALNCAEASKVQIVEMSDPVFATGLGFIFLGETLGTVGMFGGSLVLFGLLLVG